jgi:hypothetical protein
MRTILAALLISLGLASAALAQNANPPVSTQFTVYFTGIQTITKIITGSTESIYLTQLTFNGAATSVVTFSKGTGTNCGTNTVVLFTATLIAGEMVSIGDGAGAAAVIGPSVDVCITIATASANGWLSYAQF